MKAEKEVRDKLAELEKRVKDSRSYGFWGFTSSIIVNDPYIRALKWVLEEKEEVQI